MITQGKLTTSRSGKRVIIVDPGNDAANLAAIYHVARSSDLPTTTIIQLLDAATGFTAPSAPPVLEMESKAETPAAPSSAQDTKENITIEDISKELRAVSLIDQKIAQEIMAKYGATSTKRIKSRDYAAIHADLVEAQRAESA